MVLVVLFLCFFFSPGLDFSDKNKTKVKFLANVKAFFTAKVK